MGIDEQLADLVDELGMGGIKTTAQRLKAVIEQIARQIAQEEIAASLADCCPDQEASSTEQPAA